MDPHIPGPIIRSIFIGSGSEALIKFILYKETECSVCVDLRSSVIQITCGFFVPLFFSYTGAAITAKASNLRLVI